MAGMLWLTSYGWHGRCSFQSHLLLFLCLFLSLCSCVTLLAFVPFNAVHCFPLLFVVAVNCCQLLSVAVRCRLCGRVNPAVNCRLTGMAFRVPVQVGAVLCCVVLCCVVMYCTVGRCAVLCSALPCYVIWHRAHVKLFTLPHTPGQHVRRHHTTYAAHLAQRTSHSTPQIAHFTQHQHTSSSTLFQQTPYTAACHAHGVWLSHTMCLVVAHSVSGCRTQCVWLSHTTCLVVAHNVSGCRRTRGGPHSPPVLPRFLRKHHGSDEGGSSRGACER